MSEKRVVLECHEISKNFGATKALINVDLKILSGEVHGLVGENGSGKSTLSSILSGVYRADYGKMVMKDKPYKPSNIVEAENSGVAMITQEQGTVNGISIAENLFLGKERQFTKGGLLNTKVMYKKARELLEGVNLIHAEPALPIETLNFEERKLVEIARALDSNPEILIIDETTTALSADGRIIVKNIINRMRSEGKAVLFISHDIEELLENCDVITVLRDGELINTVSRKDLNERKLQVMMVGRELTQDYFRGDYEELSFGEVALEIKNLSSDKQLENVNFELHYGEILGISGLSNSGIHELGKTIFGLIKPITGAVTVKKTGSIIKNSRAALKNKIAYIPKNRDTEALFLRVSISENVAITAYEKLKKIFYISKKKQMSYAGNIIESMQIKCKDAKQNVMELSGGNKQKVVFGKWLGNDSEIFIMDCPTRGIDIGVKSAMYKLIDQMRKEKKAILLISEELPELIGMSDRILVMKDGIIQAEFKRKRELAETDIIKYVI